MIDAIQAIILGIIQGLTEWLPISSSGHLALVQLTMNLQVPIFFDVVLHLGTLAALIGVYRNELLFEESFYSMWSIGLGFMISGVMILATKFVGHGTNTIGKFDAVLIGVGQGLSIFSSISRSGATISIGMFRRIERSELITFSFLLSIPAILGAGLYDLVLVDPVSLAGMASIPVESYILGTLSAAAVGYISIKFLISIINKGEFYLFSFYCFLIGSLIFVSLI